MSKKVILVYPSHTKGWEIQPWVDIPLGLLYCATPLERAGYDVTILDQRLEPQWQRLLEKELKDRPICVGMSTTTGPQLRHALEVSRFIKKHTDVPVVWGGVHPSILPQQTLAEECVDIVVEGEGEETFFELVQALEKNKPLAKIKGLWYKNNHDILHTETRALIDLNQQPPLSWHLIKPRQYIKSVFGLERLSFSASRGCPNRCAFCFNVTFYKRRWRRLDPALIVERLKDYVTLYKIKGIFLTDSNFFVDINWARQVLSGIISQNLNIALTRIHICFDSLTRLTDQDFELLEKAGCRCLAVGIESGSERIRGLLHKEIDENRLLELNRKLSQYPFLMIYFFMVGFPTETKEELRQTVKLFSRLLAENPKAAKSVSIYTPFPGTELFDLAIKEGLAVPQCTKDWAGFNYRSSLPSSHWQTKKMTQLVEMVDFCSFFIGSHSYLNPFKKTRSWAVLMSRLYAPLAQKRLDNLFGRFPVEIKLAKLLGLFAKQE